jgi:ferrous iron transport protein B
MFKNRKEQDQDCCEGDSCDDFRSKRLEKLGLDLSHWDFVVALAGNPNTGKSTVFNSLTGLRQHTGNWPGKTVNRAEGGFHYDGNRFKIVDLPGTYSLLSTSQDEEIARNFVLFGQPDVTVVVVDATRLQRNLNLALQILEITDHVVICLNLIDEAKRNGISIDVEALKRELNVPVVPTAARYGEGLDHLLKSISDTAQKAFNMEHVRFHDESPELEKALDELQKELEKSYPNLPNARWLALRLLDGDERIEQALKSGELSELAERYNQQPVDLNRELERINQELEANHV